MKKLMIAAALAAIAGGAFADVYTNVYDFSYTVKTTGAKAGKVAPVTYTVKLGEEWWMSVDTDEFKEFEGLGEDDQAKAKKALKKLDKLAFAQYLFDVEGYEGFKLADADDDGNEDRVLEFGTPYEKDGKDVWCTSFTFKVTPKGGCYRVAKSVKAKALLLADCCDAWAFAEQDVKDPKKVIPYPAAGEFNIGLLNFFGSLDNTKAKKVEMFADWAIADDTYGACLAGQGTAKWLTDDGVYQISSVSGNIVGIHPGSVCEPGCPQCGEDLEAPIFFNCIGEAAVDAGYVSPEAAGDDPEWGDLVAPTAVYGTFKIKLNKKFVPTGSSDDE